MQVSKQAIDEIRKIHRRDGRLTPDAVVKASRRKTSALHQYFHWGDDQRMAAYGRHEIARSIIKCIVIHDVEVPSTGVRVNVREFHGVRDGTGYFSLRQAEDSPDLRLLVLQNALKDLEAFRKKYGTMKALLGAMKHVEAAIKVLGRKTKVPR